MVTYLLRGCVVLQALFSSCCTVRSMRRNLRDGTREHGLEIFLRTKVGLCVYYSMDKYFRAPGLSEHTCLCLFYTPGSRDDITLMGKVMTAFTSTP